MFAFILHTYHSVFGGGTSETILSFTLCDHLLLSIIEYRASERPNGYCYSLTSTFSCIFIQSCARIFISDDVFWQGLLIIDKFSIFWSSVRSYTFWITLILIGTLFDYARTYGGNFFNSRQHISTAERNRAHTAYSPLTLYRTFSCSCGHCAPGCSTHTRR